MHKFEKSRERVSKKLDGLDSQKIVDRIKMEHIFDTTLWKVEKEFHQSVKNITVPPVLSPERRKFIAQEYTKNMRLDIKRWVDDEIIALREKFAPSVFAGVRYEARVKDIEKFARELGKFDGIRNLQESYRQSRRKAKFWARQETNLLLCKYKQARYAESQIFEYRWRCVVGSEAHPVRKRHQELNDMSLRGKTFRFDDPPVTTEPNQPPRRNNPGEDFNCRCIAVPIVRFK